MLRFQPGSGTHILMSWHKKVWGIWNIILVYYHLRMLFETKSHSVAQAGLKLTM